MRMKLFSKKWTAVIISVVILVLLFLSRSNIVLAESAENQTFVTMDSGYVKLDQRLGVQPGAVLAELQSHEHDDYYLGTPYNGWPLTPENCLRPNGQYPGNGGMNCTGFVASVLRKCGADLSEIASFGYSGAEANAYNWFKWMQKNSVESYHFQTISELLASGYAQKGDVIFFDPVSWDIEGADCHIGFFWGDSPTDNRFWHSSIGAGRINAITELMGKCESTVYLFKNNHTGNLEVHKKGLESDAEIISGNHLYTLKGAEYTVFRHGTTEVAAVIVTDETGYGKADNLPTGTYDIRETKAPDGYVLNTETDVVTVESGGTVVYECTDVAEKWKTELLLEKLDAETGLPKAQGKASLAGAEFVVRFYDVLSDTNPEEQGAEPLRQWYFQTDKDGKIRWQSEYLTEGDPLYLNGEDVVLPLGTITIQEEKAPGGYLLNSDVFVICTGYQTDEAPTVGQILDKTTVAEQVVRGNLELVKVAGDSQKRLGHVPFRITSQTTGESHILMTDVNGEGKTAESDIWFGDGEAEKGKGRLPYDTYIIEELECEVNQDYTLIPPFEVVVERNNQVIHLGTLTNEKTPEEPEEPEEPEIPEEPEKPEEPKTPEEPEKPTPVPNVFRTVKTGDSNGLIVLIISLILSCVTVLKCVRMTRRK